LTLIIMSLGEIMNQYRVVHLVEVIDGLKRVENIIEKRCDKGERDVVTKAGDRTMDMVISPVIESCKKQCELLEMKAPLRRIAELKPLLLFGVTNEHLRVQLQEAQRDICRELEERRFAYIPVERAFKHDSLVKDWHKVIGAFPDCGKDVNDGVDSYALGLYTATVFHAMRIAETGIRTLAKRLRITLTGKKKHPLPIEYATWDEIITGIRNKINAAHMLPKGARREKQRNFYSDIADHCGYMKDLWRNPVSHARKSYNEGEALGVLVSCPGNT